MPQPSFFTPSTLNAESADSYSDYATSYHKTQFQIQLLPLIQSSEFVDIRERELLESAEAVPN